MLAAWHGGVDVTAGVFHGERFYLQMIVSGCSRLQKSLQGGFAAVCNSANEYDGVAPGGEGGPSWVSMRFGHGDGATNRATVARYRSCCLADFSAAPLVGRSRKAFAGGHTHGLRPRCGIAG